MPVISYQFASLISYDIKISVKCPLLFPSGYFTHKDENLKHDCIDGVGSIAFNTTN